MNCSYFIYINDFLCNQQDSNMRFVISYRLSTSSNFIETKLQSVIEFPYCDEDEDPSIEFQVMIIHANSERNGSAKMRMDDLQLTFEKSKSIFSLLCSAGGDFDGETTSESLDLKFLLVVEVKALVLTPRASRSDEEVHQALRSEVQIVGVDVVGRLGWEEFQAIRQEELDTQNILKSSRWFVKYRLDIKLAKQSYSVFLDDSDPTTLYYFFVNEDPSNITMIISLIELMYDDYTLDIPNQISRANVKLSSSTTLGKELQFNLTTYYLGDNQAKTAFVENFEIYENFRVSIKLTFLKNNSFTDNFLGLMSIKVLETRLFDSELKPKYLEFRLKQLDPNCMVQKWMLQPFDSVKKSTYTLNTWDFQHSLLINKLIKKDSQLTDKLTETEKSQDRRNNLMTLFSQTEAQVPVDPYLIPHSKEFLEIIKYYDHVSDYEQILTFDSESQQTMFTQRQNQVVFKTASPLDSIECIVHGECENKKGQTQKSIFGYFATNLFKVPQNQLIVGFIVKQKSGRIEIKDCMAQFENNNDQLDEMLDNDGDVQIGTMKYYVSYQGFNSLMFKNKNWINQLSNQNFSAKKFLNFMHQSLLLITQYKGISNRLSQIQKQFIISLKLVDIWNLLDLFSVVGFDKELELSIKIGQISYSIPLLVTYENKRDFLGSQLSFQLEKEKKKCVVETDGDKRKYYIEKDTEEYAIVTIDRDIAGDMIFQIFSSYDSLIVQLKLGETLYCFSSEPLKDLFIVREKGYFTVPMRLKTQMKTSVFYCNFQYSILDTKEENYDRGIYSFGVLVPAQDEQVLQKASGEVYSLSLDVEGRKHSKEVRFNNFIHFNTEKIQGAEWLTNTQLIVKVAIKKVYSDIDETLPQNPILLENTICINPSDSDVNGITIKPNYYALHQMSIIDVLFQHPLKLILYVGFRTSKFIEFPKGEVTIGVYQYCFCIVKIPKKLQDKMIDSKIIAKGGQIKLKLQSSNAESKKYPEQVMRVGEDTPDMKFQTFMHSDSFVLQYMKDGKVTDSDFTRLADLILIPYDQFLEITYGKQVDDELDEVKSILSEDSPPEVYWSFFSFNDKRLEFIIHYTPKIFDEDEDKQRLEEQRSQQERQRQVNQKKDSFYENKSIDQIKQEIKKYQEENARMGTKVQRERKLFEKNAAQKQQIIEITSKPPKVSVEATKSTTKTNVSFSENANKAKILFQYICQCGNKNPKFNGFCGDCVMKMREEYQLAQQDYIPIAEDYERLFTKNMQIDVKMVQIKKKIENFKKKITCEQNTQEFDGEEKLLKDQINYMKQQQRFVKAEINLLNNEFNRLLNDKSLLQGELEQKILNKENKLKNIKQQIDSILLQTKDLNVILKKNEENLLLLNKHI